MPQCLGKQRVFSAHTYPMVEVQDVVLILRSQVKGGWLENHPDDNSTYALNLNWVRVCQ